MMRYSSKISLSHSAVFKDWFRQATATLLLVLVSVNTLAQAPATEPLLTRAAAVRPNLLFVLDDSGSMDFDFVYARHYEVATGSCGNSDMSDLAPINNLIYYNPAKRYEPAFDNNGVQLSNAAVPGSFSSLDVYIPKAGQNITSLTTRSNICDSNRYDRVTVRNRNFRLNGSNTSTNPFTYSPTRTDCAANPCTLAEEKQNITNWRAYHNTRLKAAKVGVGKSFANQPDTFRVGYTTIHVNAADGSGSGNYKLNGVKDYFLAKTEFFTWLTNLSAGSGTPLRKALDIAGQYFSRTDKNGPWAHSPWLANSQGESSAQHLSCRRSYTILVTDGEWNGDQAPTSAARANVDGTTGTEIVHADGVTKYKYVPRSTDPRSLGKSDKITSATSTDYGNVLADVAMYYWGRDLRTDLPNNVTPGKPTDKPFWQNMSTYTAAFGPVGRLTSAQIALAKAGQQNWLDTQPSDESPETIDDLIHAAHNGGGEFLSVSDADTFASELGRVVGSIAGEQFSQAGVAASAVTLTAGTKKFVPYYTANLWWGNVKMVNLSATGDETSVEWEVVQTDALGKPTGITRMRSPTTRPVYTWSPSSKGIDFKMTSLIGSGFIASSPSNNTSTLLNSGVTADMIDYLRGERSKEGDGQPFRKRESILGDIVNSTPVFIRDISNFNYERLPSGTAGLTDYAAYKASKAARTEGVLVIGANDGMVHVFREGNGSGTGGTETFAYVPQSVLGNMHLLASKTYQHKFFVDGPMSESDAYIVAPNSNGVGSSTRWANLVVGTTGAGARSVFALDVTWPLNMNAKSILWEINHSSSNMADLGFVMSEVQTGITRSGDWVAIFGNGPYGASGRAHLFIVNLATGALIKKIDTNSATGNGLGGVRVVRNAQSQIIGAYAGDLKGNVWRFDLSATSNGSWPSSGQLLFTASDGANPQPITATPGVVPRTDNKPGYMVIVGTGKLYDDNDQSSTQQLAAYGLWDKANFGGTETFSVISGTSTLVSVSVTTETQNITTTSGLGTNPDGLTVYYKTAASRPVDWSVDRGWKLDYTLTQGQRTIFSVEPLQKVVRIDTIAPRLNQVSCSTSTSSGYNYLVDPLTGTCKQQATFDTNGDGNIDTNDSVACIYSTEADGEDVVLDIGGSGIVDIQDSRGHVRARVGDAPTPPPCTGPGCPCVGTGCSTPPGSGLGPLKRSWRQLFMR